ncbi:MAG: putative alpha-1,2-mannosidase [Cyclobacteriaceae bacterium]
MKRVINIKFLRALLFAVGVICSACVQTQEFKQPVDYINPFIGASTNVEDAGALHGLGKTFPGATTPFGLVQLSPNTITGGDNGPGYSYEHTTIEGFAFTQMSGIGWYGDLGNFLVMPATGELKTSSGRINNPEDGYRSNYSKDDEVAKAGYYAATLIDYNIRAEATAAPHSGMLRFTFPENKQSRIQIDLARRVGGTSIEQYIKVVDENTIQGWMKCTPEGGGWGNGAGQPNYTVYFYAQVSKPLKNYGIWSADIPDDWTRKRQDIESERYQERVSLAKVERGLTEKQGKHLGFFTEFETGVEEQVLLKSGISFVSMDGAKNNLLSEIPDFDFEKVRAASSQSWNEAIGKISVEGGSEEEKTCFYTALYHTMIDPRSFTDLDGSYTGGDQQIHQSNGFTKRTIFSGWDVFRSQFPLQTIINPEVVNDMINSLIELADETDRDYFERWEFLNAYSGCMLGNPAISVMVDAYNKGIRDFNAEKGYNVAKATSAKFGNEQLGFNTFKGAISSTLELSYTEWCMSIFADSLGHIDDAGKYRRLSKSYANVFDREKGWFRPKNEDGTWVEPWPEKGRLTQNYGSRESNPYQQGWFVPHDIEGLSELLGGKEAALADLTNLFNNVPEDMMWNDYYNHANEPVHHIPFIFNRLGAPWKTQYWTRQICKRAYHNAVNGLVGNEDVGQMSAWYVLAASGIHPVAPGENRYEITSPVFNRVEIKLDPKYAKGETFTIVANNNSDENIYIQSAKLNGKNWNNCWITHEQLAAGGVLELKMGKQPNESWGNDVN